MTAKGHVSLALPVAFIGAAYLNLTGLQAIVFIFIISVFSLFPDIDEPGSYIGRRLGFLSIVIKILSYFFPAFKHRGVTHYFVVPFIISVIALIAHNVYIAAIGVGIFLHTVGDMLTKGGINGYFYPFMKNKKIGLLPVEYRFYTGSIAETLVVLVLSILNFYLFIKYFYNFVH